jgi:signal transduction histidine kinase/DNA-binding response OmpR family regulator/CHASE3 domain sensor protein
MNHGSSVNGSRPSKDNQTLLWSGLVGVVVFFVAGAFIGYWNARILNEDSLSVVRTHEAITALDDLLATLTDAETGQRGYLITGDPRYLDPYLKAKGRLDDRIDELARITEKDTAEAARLRDIQQHIRSKMSELAETIELRGRRGFDAARAVVVGDRGRKEMDDLRAEIGLSVTDEQNLRDRRLNEMSNAYRTTISSTVVTGLLGILLSAIVVYLFRRSSAMRIRQQWLQAGQVGLSEAMFGGPRLEVLGENVLRFLCEYLNAQAGVIFARVENKFSAIASYGVEAGSSAFASFREGDGLLGQAAKDNRCFVIEDVPEGYLTIDTTFLKGKPQHLLVCAASVDRVVNSVIELGFTKTMDPLALELLEAVSSPLGLSVRAAQDRGILQNLLEETQQQGEELQTQSEELRTSNEELAEQSRALRASQARLESQRTELEQTNLRLSNQARLLESQRDDLNKSKDDLETRAKQLEQMSRYKSEFLANMSHELRTPLNSSIILAKLLGDNREGNLSEEQIRYAQTIQTAGNDLLALIGDILDLSKIEAGKMQLVVQRTVLRDLVDELAFSFEPMAREKALQFSTYLAEGCPTSIKTDSRRLIQILKNLLSNAIKFTESGEVRLAVHRSDEAKVSFDIIDTGIGVAIDQQDSIFEAFRQVDSSTNRKYGGTGLGLSIARDMAELLGGVIKVKSELGTGSTFTLTVPEAIGEEFIVKATEDLPILLPSRGRPPSSETSPTRAIADDRLTLTEGGRTILIIEDDESFARILYDLAHEQGFECLVASTAEDGLALAAEFIPNAILLDIRLPDHSGLTVLDQIKHDVSMRHIPVHILSGVDYAHTARMFGAAGYMLKPVKREELVHKFEELQAKLTQRLRRVLIVEDDETQLDSLQLLLGTQSVETEGVRSAAECLEVLKNQTFDCMVLDLSLPDSSGFVLLETLSREDAYAFPPVIVYTGRDLTFDEEQDLLRYSQSIIVKGAKSPERLLDEVTLFLHQIVAELPPEKQKLLIEATSRDSMLTGRVILLVEDDVRNIFALTSVLEPHGARIEIARNGREALQFLEQMDQASHSTVDLILMDIMMPVMDGFEAMRQIRKRPEWKKIPIIALTAKAMKDDQEQCLQAGASDYIAKPLDVDQLLSLLRVWMPRRQ